MPEVVQIGGVLYVLRERRGGGEFADVFRASEATDKDPDRDVLYAIKRLRPDVDHPDFQDMRAAGIREFVHQLMLAVENRRYHDNIVSVRFAQQVGEYFYIVMEFCEGSLANLFECGHHGEDWILPVGHDLLTGLHFIHDLGALHNDLHSGNVLFSRDLAKRPGPFKSKVFFPLHGPGLFTFKIGDFGFGGRWFRNENDEHPDLIVGDIRMAAQVLVDVAVGRQGAFLEPDVLDRRAGRYAYPIRRALEGGFAGERAALDLLEALTQAQAGPQDR
jgi:serine/threonine protein kinase